MIESFIYGSLVVVGKPWFLMLYGVCRLVDFPLRGVLYRHEVTLDDVSMYFGAVSIAFAALAFAVLR